MGRRLIRRHDLALYDGRAYVTGGTLSTDFPTTDGALDRTHNGQNDVFVTKLHTDGSVLSYSTYIGGTQHDGGLCIAVEGGLAYVAGETTVDGFSNNFPTTPGAYDTTPNGFTGGIVGTDSSSSSMPAVPHWSTRHSWAARGTQGKTPVMTKSST